MVDRQLLHVPRLRNQHRLQLANAPARFSRKRPRGRFLVFALTLSVRASYNAVLAAEGGEHGTH